MFRGKDEAHVVWVSSDGDDANDGLSPKRPKRTLGAAADALPDGGGEILWDGDYVFPPEP